MRKLVAAAAIALSLSVPAQAEPVPLRLLVDMLNENNAASMVATGFVFGTIDTYQLDGGNQGERGGAAFCLPPSLSRADVTGAVIAWIKSRTSPVTEKVPAVAAIIGAASTLWPCQ